MSKRIKLIASGFVSALTIIIATSMPAQAGTLTIFNKNCTKTYNFATKKRVKVRIYANGSEGCTQKRVTVHQGRPKTIELMEQNIDGDDCGKYAHEAIGTVMGKYDAPADEDTHVTCKKDWAAVCQCTKD